MLLNVNILASIFGDTDMFCGTEDVIHTIIYHHLLEFGLSPIQVEREHQVLKSRIDIVVFDEQVNGQFKNSMLQPKLAVEVKGGAHGTMNALHTAIAGDGTCLDLEKLEKEVAKGINSWFICVDMPELGKAVNNRLLQKLHDQCKQRKISLAYFCQGEKHFFYAPVNGKGSKENIIYNNSFGSDYHVKSIINKGNPLFTKMCEQLLKINGHEANTTAALYHLFRMSGLSAAQISLETYFSFAKRVESTMHDRPDMVLFNKSFNGMFNLYKKGKMNSSNDSHKLDHINTIFEVKGSSTMNSKGDKARLKIYLSDIEKLRNWQVMAKSNECKSLNGYFICLDGRNKSLPITAVQEMFELSGNNPVVYISHSGIEISNENN